MKDYSPALAHAKSLLLETGVMAPVHAEALQQLNENINAAKARGESGELSEVEAWKEGDTIWIVDGYHRLQLYLKKKMYVTKVNWMTFQSKKEAIEYAVAKESTGREKTAAQLKLMRARMVELFTKLDKPKQAEKAGLNPQEARAKSVGKAKKVVSAVTKSNAVRLKRDKMFTKALEACDPWVGKAVEAGVIDPSDTDVKALAKMDAKEQRKVVAKVRKQECSRVADAIKEVAGASAAEIAKPANEPLSSPQITDPKNKSKLAEARSRAIKAYEEMSHAINGLAGASPNKECNQQALKVMKQLYAVIKEWK